MPIINVTLVEGRPDAHVEAFIKRVAEVAAEELHAPLETVRVMVNEVPKTRFAVGNVLKSEQ
ncbi:tautomerase family protein [Enemella sp. A6]|uniref:tautomerase family protein n=1 Tax=Enemella sp. A6 TaxID=3440152 RepID=UPI003EB78A9B